MKLTKLHIYGFGRFQDKHIDLSANQIHIFLGENEAGKSTIMAFIRSIFFGFPQKNGNELRFEPRLGGRYGGSIALESHLYGSVTVERVLGKASGDVKIYFSDGSIGQEKDLQLLLNEMDRTIFTGIYSFGLTDLQTLDQLDSDELNKFMYGVGVSGRHNLLEFEKKNEKQLQALYKPTGRKPVINERLTQVIELEEKLISWRQKESYYDQLVKEREELIETLETVNNEQREHQEEYRYFQKLASVSSIILKKNMLENQLSQLPPHEPFPEDGLERFEKLSERSITTEGEMNELQKKLTTISFDKIEVQCHDQYDVLKEAIEESKHSKKLYELKQNEKSLLQQQIQYEKQEFDLIQEKIGYEYSNFSTSYVAEEQMTKLVAEEQGLKQQHVLLETKLNQGRQLLEEKERDIEKIKPLLLDGAQKQQFQQKLLHKSSKDELEQRFSYVVDHLQLVSNQLAFVKRKKAFMIFLMIFTSSLTAYLFVQNQLLLSIAGLVMTLGILAFSSLHTTKNAKLLTNKKNTLQKEKEAISTEMELANSSDFEHFELLVAKDDQYLLQLQLKQQSLLEVKNEYEHICKQLDTWELAYSQFRQQLNLWATTFGYPVELEAREYLKLLKVMEELKKKERQILFLQEKLGLLENDATKLEENVKILCEKLEILYEPHAFLQNVDKLISFAKNEAEKEKVYTRLCDQEVTYLDTKNTLVGRLGQLKREISKLFQLADVSCEEHFRKKGKAWIESQQIKNELRNCTSQLRTMIKSEKELQKLERDVLLYSEALNEKISEIERKISHCREEEKKKLKRLAELNLEINELEEGSSHSLSLHNFEKEKGILRGEVRTWAVHRTVQLLIDEAKKLYERERQPEVVKEATKMFRQVTNGEYVKLFAPIGEQRFIVERNDGLMFQPHELSQGTKEQLYLSIRLALATVHSKQLSFPIFIDDILVNFDEKRRLQAIRLLKEMSKKHQIIFFTCHLFMAKEISNDFYSLTKENVLI